MLKLNIQKSKIMESGHITSWEIDEETVETVSDFIFLGSKITADGNCSHEIERRLLLGRKVTREPGRAPPRHAHGDLTSLAPHERLPEILVVPREKTLTGAAARGNP